ncbi:DUF3768 domain-containing protein [uncultured Hyphomicrobium sp.]|uniref:DUF3768 domain-containing protein n=1 Tax=uncultured Hyphomicrobium sp. TaxID=194373 RepID=UPI0025EE37E1|nr:DUF3768 domain-containing protein [uncultured Hyphomicrobium sp.]
MSRAFEAAQVEKIRALNDAFRKHPYAGLGKVVMTQGVNMISGGFAYKALAAVQAFDRFDRDNDPHGEHDFVSVEVDGQLIFGKIDYFDREMECGSEDPSNPDVTTRVLTIMLADEY